MAVKKGPDGMYDTGSIVTASNAFNNRNAPNPNYEMNPSNGADDVSNLMGSAKQGPQDMTYELQQTRMQQEMQGRVANTNAAVANAKPGNWIMRSNGQKYVLTQGDIDWAKKQTGGTKPNPPKPNPDDTDDTSKSKPGKMKADTPALDPAHQEEARKRAALVASGGTSYPDPDPELRYTSDLTDNDYKDAKKKKKKYEAIEDANWSDKYTNGGREQRVNPVTDAEYQNALKVIEKYKKQQLSDNVAEGISI